VDLEYLRDKADKAWINLIEGDSRLNHGGALTQLLNNCNTDLAMILDNDIQILGSGWLEEMVSLVQDNILAVWTIEYNYKSYELSFPDWIQTWFFMLNMQIYRDGMEIDWNRAYEDKNKEPFKSLMRDDERLGRSDLIALPPGTKLLLKIKYDNPKGYKIISPTPKYIKDKYVHYAHVSSIATEDLSDSEKFKKARREKMDRIKYDLMQLRGQ